MGAADEDTSYSQNTYLFSFKSFVSSMEEVENYFGASFVEPTTTTTTTTTTTAASTGRRRRKRQSSTDSVGSRHHAEILFSGKIQSIVAKALAANNIDFSHHVALNSSELYYGYYNDGTQFEFVWCDDNSNLKDEELILYQQVTQTRRMRRLVTARDVDADACAEMTLNDSDNLRFRLISCGTLLPPLCMRGLPADGDSSTDTINITSNTVSRKRKRQKNKKKSNNIMKKLRGKQKWAKSRKRVGFNKRPRQGRSHRQARQNGLEAGGPAVEMCANPVVWGIVGPAILGVANPGTLAAAAPPPAPPPPAPAPAQPPPPQPQPSGPQSVQELNPTQTFDQFMGTFGDAAAASRLPVDPITFGSNLAVINGHNTAFLLGQQSFFLTVNQFTAVAFTDFAARYGGAGSFANNTGRAQPQFDSRGELQVEEEPPTSLDWMNDECAQSSILREQICNNCAAHSTTSVLEYCFCLAGDRSFSPRTVQQFSECTDQQALDAGSQLERKNAHCVTGFPDVHMDFILKSLSGTVDAEQIVPEDNFCTDPDAPLPDDYDPYDYDFTLPCRCLEEAQEPPARARMTDFMFDYFTTEDYIVDALQTGPVTTSMIVTPLMQSYGGGVYYNFEECDDYGPEEVPADCKVQPYIVSEINN